VKKTDVAVPVADLQSENAIIFFGDDFSPDGGYSYAYRDT
jgi:hypothetical protein